MLWYIFSGFCCVVLFDTSIPMYDVGSFCRCLEVVEDTIDDILAIFARSQNCLFFFAKMVVAIVVVALATHIHDLIGMCNAVHPNYADGIFASILHDAGVFGCMIHN